MQNLMPEHERAPRQVSDTVAAIEAEMDGYVAPHAYAVGVATVSPLGNILDVSFPHVNCDESWGTAAVLAKTTGYRDGSESYQLSADVVDDAISALAELATGDGPHLNLDAWTLCNQAAAQPALGGDRVVVACMVDNLFQPPVDTIDAYLRLHLLSHRKMVPNSMNLNGIFGLLNTAVWTNLGPFEPENFEMTRMALKADGHNVEVNLVDKFPRMLDYVVPTGVRIADANRVRMGAYLSEGTVIMHEGFCNFNAGTLGPAMVEGRISQGVVVGEHSDIGGGASIMGTLSGGGTEVVSVGKNSLVGANGGIGISLGDDCIVEAGCYITAGTLVTMPDGEVVKAKELSGHNGLLFRRNSKSGVIEAIAREGAGWQGLNTDLHDN
jgi:2,3,4,5-tetrahydropyridine-2-carboxylate N-succinyltransferase